MRQVRDRQQDVLDLGLNVLDLRLQLVDLHRGRLHRRDLFLRVLFILQKTADLIVRRIFLIAQFFHGGDQLAVFLVQAQDLRHISLVVLGRQAALNSFNIFSDEFNVEHSNFLYHTPEEKAKYLRYFRWALIGCVAGNAERYSLALNC